MLSDDLLLDGGILPEICHQVLDNVAVGLKALGYDLCRIIVLRGEAVGDDHRKRVVVVGHFKGLMAGMMEMQ